MLSAVKHCFSKCEMFRCGKNSVQYRGSKVWCRWTDEECNIANCSYATCGKRRLLPGGICGESIKRKTIDREPDEVLGPTVKLKGKVFRKVGEKEIF